MLSLPPELIADIVDGFADDTESLKACSLIAPAFCPPAQRHIFKSIWLYREDCRDFGDRDDVSRSSASPGTIQKGFLLLQNSPHIARYIRDLTIDLPDSTNELLPLEGVLRMLQTVDRFVIAGHWLSWDDLPNTLASTILGILAQPTLSRLHILDIRALPPVVVLRAMSSVRIFSLCSTRLANDDQSSDKLTIEASPQWEHLTMGYSSLDGPRISELLLSSRASGLSRLTRLSIYVDTRSRPYAERLLAATSDTLKQLDLEYRFHDPFQPLRLPHLPQLRAMDVYISLTSNIQRDFSDIFSVILAPLPPVVLTVEFFLLQRSVETLHERNWLNVAPDSVPKGWDMHSVEFRLVFESLRSDNPRLEGYPRSKIFDTFGVAIKKVFPGRHITLSRGRDVFQPYIERLP